MCGITGILAFNLVGKFHRIHVTSATQALHRRGPDHQDVYTDDWAGLGHRRLSIIDTSAIAHQPMWDEQRRYAIVFNGEIFNFPALRQALEQRGITFFSNSDTEVLLKLYLTEGESCLNKLNGFFAFCIYDREARSFFVARDRYGVKPLLYVMDEDKFLFASELKSLVEYGIARNIDAAALQTFLQLNYIPAPASIFKAVRKLMPGHCLTIRQGTMTDRQWYSIPYDASTLQAAPDYATAQRQLADKLDQAVQRRLISDVPLGAFLSGGIDSSVICALASRHKPSLHTFSIGYRDEPYFDETNYARLVAKKLGTEHTVFSLTNNDFYGHVHDVLDYMDEPFADSSGLAVYILSKETRRFATVALSGDGADELASGYNKHAAYLRSIRPGMKEQLASALLPLWKLLPQSRHAPMGNKIRQLVRFGEGMRLPERERYWRWATYASAGQVNQLLTPQWREENGWATLAGPYLDVLGDGKDFNRFLLADMQLVLPNDMLVKVDWMSMANGLEVRTPFLDVDVVNFMFSLPDSYKINAGLRKRIVQDAFRDLLPPELYNRPKRGFEVPLLKWLRTEMRATIEPDWLGEKFVREQGVFDYPEVAKLKQQLFSSNPGDVHARIWALLTFQSWWKRYMPS